MMAKKVKKAQEKRAGKKTLVQEVKTKRLDGLKSSGGSGVVRSKPRRPLV